MVSAEGFWVQDLAHILGDFLGVGDGGSGRHGHQELP
jgi:hypothetical protein